MDVNESLFHWIAFNIAILGLLILDLVYFHYRPHRMSIKEAMLTSLGWISLALAFNAWIYIRFGAEAGLAFLTGYLLEKSLSVDNLFVFLLIFSHFKVPSTVRHTVLFYGILGAILMRAALIAGGIALVHSFSWIFYIFGLFLIYTGIRLAFNKEEQELKHEEHIIYRLLSRLLPMANTYQGDAFVIRQEGKWVGTPLLVVLVLIETTDLIFALDSVPAIFGITTDAFIVYTSNIFAILGLRSLFFVLEDVITRFYLLHYALALILVFIGVKMLLANIFHIPLSATFTVLLLSLGTALLGSFLFPKNAKTPQKKDFD